MEGQNFKEQQQDRIEEGKDLKREDEVTDISQIPSKQLPGVESKSLFSKISEGISNVASVISDKVGFNPIIEGHEELDRDVKRQVKKINKEILKKSGHDGSVEEKPSEWETALPKQVKKEVEDAKKEGENLTTSAKESTSVLGKIQHSVTGVTGSISQGVDSIKQRFVGGKTEESNDRADDGTKEYKKVNDGFNETVDELNHEKRVEEFGEQEQLKSQNPFRSLDSGSDNKVEGENVTLGDKIKESGNKITTKVGEVSQKVKSTFAPKTVQNKENSQQIA